MARTLIAALYKFVALDDFESLKQPIEEACRKRGIRGTLLLAQEGLNGTIAGEPEKVRDFLRHLKEDPRLVNLEHKESFADSIPFIRLKVRLKKEIVTMGLPHVDPTKSVGTYVDAKDWNSLVKDPDVLVIDTRNDYESEVGTFEGSILPQTESFRDFPQWFKGQKELRDAKKIAMFCTGGIRCEKATSYVLQNSDAEVYHLKGGILRYLEDITPEESLWHGECFVFDQRVTVDHNLEPGNFEQCFGCRRPIDEQAQNSPQYQKGISCPQCYEQLSDEQKQRFAERQKQINLAKSRFQTHLGQADG